MNSNDEGVAILLATGSGAFLPPTSLAVGTSPRAIAAADLNEDGIIDLAVTSEGERNLSVLLGIGDGSFSPRRTFAMPVRILSVAVGHFNGDAHAALAVSGGGIKEPAILAILAGDGQGGFGPPNVVASIATFQIAVLDFNNDGKDDLAGFWGGFALLAGNGDGTFQAPDYLPPGEVPRAFTVGDFNADGRIDVAVALQNFISTRTLLVFLGNASGLGKSPSYPGAFAPKAVTVGDFNHDGRSDLAIADYSDRFSPAGSVSVLLSQPDGSLSAPARYLTVAQPSSIRTADFNGDGHLDLACANSFQISILLGTGTGSFSVATNFSPGTLVGGIDTADFNEDGKIDLVFSNSDGLTILFGDGTGGLGSPITHPFSFATPPVSGDFNLDGHADVMLSGAVILYGDGTGHFGDPSYLAGGGFQKFLVSDFNGDGLPDIAGVASGTGSVLLGQVGGGFGSPLPFPVEFAASIQISVTAADFDLDGKMDLAVLTNDSVSFLRGKGDGTFSKAGYLLAGSGVFDLVSGLFNADGRPDLVAISTSSLSGSTIGSDVFVLLNTNCVARRLEVTRNPSICNLPGVQFEVQPVVKVYDDGDNVVSCVGGAVQASLLPGSGSPGAHLGGPTASTVVSGTATFRDLAVDAVGEGYVLQFSRSGLVPARSRIFRVDPGCKGPFSFFTLTPCRIADTRDAAGIWGAPSLLSNTTRIFPIAGRCGVPVTARSVAVNVTVVNPTDSGHLTLFPAGRLLPLASTINFRGGVVRANNSFLKMGDAGDVGVNCVMPANPASRVDFILDVSGYFQ
jgi:hypothetical protein